jgi:hypothetical protein
MNDFIWRFRTVLYILALIAIVLGALALKRGFAKRDEIKSLCDARIAMNEKAFFPPDIVPHPHPPHEEEDTRDDKEKAQDPEEWA